MAQHHDESRAESRNREFDAADLRWRDDVAGDPDDEQVTESLPEDQLCGDARVRASEDHGEWLLPVNQLAAAALTETDSGVLHARDKALIALSQACECFGA